MSPRTLLIDGDILAYRVTAAAETPIDWGNDLWTLHADLSDCRDNLDRQIAMYLEELKADDIILAFSPPKNFRYRIYPQYKSHRQGKRKPVTYIPLKEYAHERYKTFERPDLEGDDVLGILATSPVIVKGEKVIVSLDKDLKTIPGLICDMREPITIQEITEEEADYNHMYQTLVGDTADGYPGCPGIGPVSATKLLADVPRTYADMWPAVVKAYEKKGLSEEVALVQAQIARICRRDDYDFKKKEVILWTPK
jgi:DNA polymerase-1